LTTFVWLLARLSLSSQVSLVKEADLETVSKTYEKILSRHIYSVQKNPAISSTGQYRYCWLIRCFSEVKLIDWLIDFLKNLQIESDVYRYPSYVGRHPR
jgi:hypothetical protein